jgi:hypothetical protein
MVEVVVLAVVVVVWGALGVVVVPEEAMAAVLQPLGLMCKPVSLALSGGAGLLTPMGGILFILTAPLEAERVVTVQCICCQRASDLQTNYCCVCVAVYMPALNAPAPRCLSSSPWWQVV